MAKDKKAVREVFVPIDYRNRKKTHLPVCLNGVWYQVTRGERVEVPAGVAGIVENALQQEEAAYQMRAATLENQKDGL